MSTSTLEHILQENYILAKIRGEKGFLQGRQQLHSLSEFRGLSEMLGALADGPFGKELSALRDGSSPIEMERAIRMGFTRAVEILIASSQGSVREFLQAFTRRFEAYNIAALVVFKAQRKSWEEFVASRQPMSVFKESELHRGYSLDDLQAIVGILGDRSLEARVERFSMTELEGEKASLVRDIITGWGEEKFYKYVDEKLSGIDKSSSLPIAGSAVDIANVTIILRSKIIGGTNVQDHIIPSFWKLDQRSVAQLLASQDVSQALDFIASHHYYRRVLLGAAQKYDESKSLSFLEIALRKHQLGLSRRMFLGFPYTIGIVLAFLILKENEARNIAAILTGVEAGLQPDELRSLLVVPD